MSVSRGVSDFAGKRPATPNDENERQTKQRTRELVKVVIAKRGGSPEALEIVLITPKRRLPPYGGIQNVQFFDEENDRERIWKENAVQLKGFYGALGISEETADDGQKITDTQLRSALELAEEEHGSPCIIRGLNFAAALDVPLLVYETDFLVALPETIQPPAFQSSDASPELSKWYPEIVYLTSPQNLWSYLKFSPTYVLFDPSTEKITDGIHFLSLKVNGNNDSRNNRMIVYKDDEMVYLLDPKTLCPAVECEDKGEGIYLQSFFYQTPRALVEQIANDAKAEPKFQGRPPPKSILAKRGMLFVKCVQQVRSQISGKNFVELFDSWSGKPFKFYQSDFQDGVLAMLKLDKDELWTEEEDDSPANRPNRKKYKLMRPRSHFFKEYLTRNGIRRWLNGRLEQEGQDLEDTISRMMKIGYYGIYIEPPVGGPEGFTNGSVEYNTQGRASVKMQTIGVQDYASTAGKRDSDESEGGDEKRRRLDEINDIYSLFLRAFDDLPDHQFPRFKSDCVLYTSQPSNPDPPFLSCNSWELAPPGSWSCKPISASCRLHCILDPRSGKYHWPTPWWKGQDCFALRVKKGTRALALSLPSHVKKGQSGYSEVLFPPGTIYTLTEETHHVKPDPLRDYDPYFGYLSAIKLKVVDVSSPEGPPSETNLPMFYEVKGEREVDRLAVSKTSDIASGDIEDKSGFDESEAEACCNDLVAQSREHLSRLFEGTPKQKKIAQTVLSYPLGLSSSFKWAFEAHEDVVRKRLLNRTYSPEYRYNETTKDYDVKTIPDSSVPAMRAVVKGRREGGHLDVLDPSNLNIAPPSV